MRRTDPYPIPHQGLTPTHDLDWPAKQLDAQVVTESGPKGTTVSVTHATFVPAAAVAAIA